MKLFGKWRAKFGQLSMISLTRILGIAAYFWFCMWTLTKFIKYALVNGKDALPQGLNWIGPDNSIVLWGWLWGIACGIGMVSCFLILFKKASASFFISISMLISLQLVWGLAYAVGWLFRNGQTEWLAMGTQLGPVGLLFAFLMGGLKERKTLLLPISPIEKEITE